MDDEILLPDRGKAIAAMVTDAIGITRSIGYEFEIRPVQLGDLRHLVERKHAIDLEQSVIRRVERALHEALQLGRHIGLDIEPDHQTAAAAFERSLKQPHQVFGFFKDFELGVADDAERAYSLHRVAGKQFADEKAGHAFDRDQANFATLPDVRQPRESLDAVRHADQSVHRLAVFGPGELQGDRETQIRNKRERMRRIDRERGQQRENMRQEIIFEPGLLRFGDLGSIDQHDAGLSQRRPQFAPLRLLIMHQQHDRFGDAHKLFGRGQSLRALGGDAGAHLRAQAGDPHHEEFIEVVRRDRQEFQPLQQRMSAVGGFFENAAIEIEPGQFPIDEAIRACCQRRRGVLFRGLRQAYRRGQAARLTGFECDSGRLAAIDHSCSLFREPHPRWPR